MTKPVEIISPDPTHAYAALARRIAAIDAILLCSGITKSRDDRIRAEVNGAMQVIYEYERVVFSCQVLSPAPQTPEQVAAGLREAFRASSGASKPTSPAGGNGWEIPP